MEVKDAECDLAHQGDRVRHRELKLAHVQDLVEGGGAQLEQDGHLERLEARAQEPHDVRVAQVAHELHFLHELLPRRLRQALA